MLRGALNLFLAGSMIGSSTVAAGTVDIRYFAEIDGTFSGGNVALPGRSTIAHDVGGSQLTDLGIQAFSDPDTGVITSIAKIDLADADANLWGIGIGRSLFGGGSDTTFGGGDGRAEFTTLQVTNVIDACRDESGRYVVAVAVPGAQGSGGPKDLGLVRFTAAGAIDTSYSGDGKVVFSLADGATDFDEAINDLECVPGGYLVGGFITQNGQQGFMARLPASGNVDVPSASTVFGNVAGDQGGQVTAVHYNDTRSAYVVALTILGDTTPSRSIIAHYQLQNGVSFSATTPGPVIFGADHCTGFPVPSISGIDRLGPNDYAVSLNYTGNGVRRAAVGRINVGENLLVGCTAAEFAVTNAAVTPPLVYAGHVFVGLGVAPFHVTPVASQVRVYAPSASGLTLLVEPGFGANGLTQWQHAFSAANANNNRSFLSRLYVDPAGLVMGVGTRVWSGNDTDVALVRLGSYGVFASGFETVD